MKHDKSIRSQKSVEAYFKFIMQFAVERACKFDLFEQQKENENLG
jgi:hypothetical protein